MVSLDVLKHNCPDNLLARGTLRRTFTLETGFLGFLQYVALPYGPSVGLAQAIVLYSLKQRPPQQALQLVFAGRPHQLGNGLVDGRPIGTAPASEAGVIQDPGAQRIAGDAADLGAGDAAGQLAVANYLPVFVIDRCPQAPIGEITILCPDSPEHQPGVVGRAAQAADTGGRGSASLGLGIFQHPLAFLRALSIRPPAIGLTHSRRNGKILNSEKECHVPAPHRLAELWAVVLFQASSLL